MPGYLVEMLLKGLYLPEIYRRFSAIQQNTIFIESIARCGKGNKIFDKMFSQIFSKLLKKTIRGNSNLKATDQNTKKVAVALSSQEKRKEFKQIQSNTSECEQKGSLCPLNE